MTLITKLKHKKYVRISQAKRNDPKFIAQSRMTRDGDEFKINTLLAFNS